MRKFSIPILLLFFFLDVKAQSPQQLTLPNGWSLSPAGIGFTLGDLPLNMAVSLSKKWIAVTNNGYSRQSIQLIDTRKQKIADDITIAKSWVGLKFSKDEKYLYASGGNDNDIIKYALINGKLHGADTLRIGKKELISPAGLDFDDKRNLLYVVTKENNSLYIVNTISKKVIGQYSMDGEGYTCLLSPKGNELYISCWGCDQLLVFDTRQKLFVKKIKVGDNPNDLCLTKNGKYLFVANSNDNSVSVISTLSGKVIETLTSSLYPDAPQGSTTNGVALSADEKTLYIANADNNCLTLFDVSHPGRSVAKGFIPTGWYPTCVRTAGNKIFVTNGKGFSSFANPDGPNPTYIKGKVMYQHSDTTGKKYNQYIGGLFIGTMSVIKSPDASQLANYSKQVYANTPYNKQKESLTQGEEGNPIPRSTKDVSPIKYVFYIIKENRTYDQVLGDIPEGNGDTSLLLFGEKFTPNQHTLVKEFALLDNFYVDAEVSADGHNWSLGAYATDYLEKTWPTSYGGRGGNYDAEGIRKIANNKNGFIWDNCSRNNVSYRTYGEFADDYKANIPVLKDHFCTYYTSWDMSTPDTTRFVQWQKDFDSLVRINALPRLNTLRFPNDHTEGMRKGSPTPFAHVADNDLAVGKFLQHLSESPVWKESVVFILEDDAQNGPDHVDAHRSPIYIAGPYVKRNFVDHTPYTTSGVVRTIQLILGIPPMSQFDAAATPLWRCFTSTPNYTSFTSLPSNIDLSERNIANNKLSKKSETFNFTKEDAINDNEFNEVLWKGIKGLNSEVPSPRRAAFLKSNPKEKDDD